MGLVPSKKTRETVLSPRSASMWGHRQKTVFLNQEAGPRQTEPASALILDAPASRSVRSVCCFSPVCGIFVRAVQMDQDARYASRPPQLRAESALAKILPQV